MEFTNELTVFVEQTEFTHLGGQVRFSGLLQDSKKAYSIFIKYNRLFDIRRCKPFRETFRDKTDRKLLHYFCQTNQINSQVRKSTEGCRKRLTSWEGINFLERTWRNGEKEKAIQSEASRRQKAMKQCILIMTILVIPYIQERIWSKHATFCCYHLGNILSLVNSRKLKLKGTEN